MERASPQRQAEDGLSAEARFVARAEALTDAEFARMHLSAWGMELDAATILRMRLAENVVHTWDIEVTRDPSARLPADAVDLLVDHLLLMATLSRGKPQGKTFALRVRSADPEREFYLAVADGVKFEPWADQEVDGELRITAEGLIRLVYGRLDSAHPPGSVEITAPNLHLDALREVFPGV